MRQISGDKLLIWALLIAIYHVVSVVPVTPVIIQVPIDEIQRRANIITFQASLIRAHFDSELTHCSMVVCFLTKFLDTSTW